MKKVSRLALLCSCCIMFGMTAAPSPAHAYFHHHHGHTKHHKKKHHASSALVRDAQDSLINLGYLTGKADGIVGPKTTGAIKAFQKDHHLVANGRLTRETYNAIVKADRSRAMAALPVPKETPTTMVLAPIPVPSTLPAQPGLAGVTNQQYADPLLGGVTVAGSNGAPQAARTQELSSRYAKLDVNENSNGAMRRYSMTLDGTPILLIDNQPSIIGISQTYALNDEDVIILTSYNDGDRICPYKHSLLTITQGSRDIRPIKNCTHGYQARKVEDSLFITFPEVDDEREAGATFRYEAGDLEKM